MTTAAPAAAGAGFFGPASLALQASGALMGIVSSYYSAKSQKSALRHQAEIAEINAGLAELAAQNETLAGQREEQKLRLRTGGIKAGQRVAMAANGIDIANSPTAQNILNSTDILGEIDAQTIQANAVRSAWGYRTQASNLTSEAAMARATASGISPGMSALSSMLTGAGQVASSWYSLNKAGALTRTTKAGAMPTSAGSSYVDRSGYA